jgi:hypothetical protein
MLHHGGSGSFGVCTRLGVPQVAAPFMFDQFFWADRISWLGCGPDALPLRHIMPAVEVETPAALTPEAWHVVDECIREVSARLRSCLRPETVARALEVAAELRADGDGLKAACKVRGMRATKEPPVGVTAGCFADCSRAECDGSRCSVPRDVLLGARVVVSPARARCTPRSQARDAHLRDRLSPDLVRRAVAIRGAVHL